MIGGLALSTTAAMDLMAGVMDLELILYGLIGVAMVVGAGYGLWQAAQDMMRR